MHIRNYGHSRFSVLPTYHTYVAKHNRLKNAFAALLKPFVKGSSNKAYRLKVLESDLFPTITNSHKLPEKVAQEFVDEGYRVKRNLISVGVIEYNWLKKIYNYFFLKKNGLAAVLKLKIKDYNYFKTRLYKPLKSFLLYNSN